MKEGPDIARVAALIGDPARANMLCALLGGAALSAGELARQAGVTAQTTSSHLARLEAGRLIARRRSGRHSYFVLADDSVGAALESLTDLASRAGAERTRPGPRDPQLRAARVCYDHLAGEAGVAMFDRLHADGRLAIQVDGLVLTEEGRRFATDFGVNVDLLASRRRKLARACLDWSERRNHLAGALGASLLARLFEVGWARRASDSRAVLFTDQGRRAFERLFGAAPIGGGDWPRASAPPS
ncbi:MAG: ArsR/SmtB family transcription factor [Caulobacteraceae bacterium]